MNYRRIIAGAFFAGAVLASGAANAQAPLRFIVPFGVGGSADVLARFVAAELSPRINQTVVVVNQPGASGLVGTMATFNSPPDGNTILLAGSNHPILAATKKNLAFDVVKDFQPVVVMAHGPLVFSANPNAPFKTLPEMIAYAKANPGGLKYATAGEVGSVPHLAAELLGNEAKVSMKAVPYPSGGAAALDVMAGVVPMGVSALTSVLPYYETNKLVAIAQTPKTRSPLAPNIPTVHELTGLDYDLTYWVGVLAPRGTPDTRVAQLNKEINEILRSEKGRTFFMAQGFEPAPGTSAEFASFLAKERKLWVQIGKMANIQPQ
ncbi:Bug family tripartite tricarboxylate transporter substrate binding protein [Ancylobacter polymorphus]|uniref:ABC transporter substrate-binding protein n=1 Tax=Ancylobacter polymorphus TaxID=223390 RepID=A0A9E7D628_9HYPH|nr:tripartite tricarboxylate transporter substrate-binding protein [Ancylobacter polymorphus]UOK73312.1 hypothetical protein K9D25_21955 [Ancylobacter polymorphus]